MPSFTAQRTPTRLAFTHSPGQETPGASLSSIHGPSAGSNWEIMSGLEIGIPSF